MPKLRLSNHQILAGILNRIFGRGDSAQYKADVAASNTDTRSLVTASTLDDADVFLKKLGLSHLRVDVNARTAMGIAAFYGCVKFISNTISWLPYTVYRSKNNKGGIEATNHALYRILKTRLNKHMTPLVGRRTILTNCLVHGWSVSEIKRGFGGLVSEIVPYPCSQVFIIHEESLDEYYFHIPHLSKILDESEVIFIKDLSFDGNLGASIISWQDQTIKINLYAKRFVEEYLQKRTFIGGILKTDEAKTEEAAKTIKERLLEAIKGNNNGGMGLMVTKSNVEYTPVGYTPVESQLNETFKLSAEEIAMMFNLPLSAIGVTTVQSSWGAGVEQMYKTLANSVLIPIATQIEQEIDYKCFTSRELSAGYYTKHSFTGLLKGDLKSLGEYYSKLVNAGILTPDEVRDLDDYEPLPEGTGSKAYMNGTMRPLNLLGVEHNQNDRENVNGDQDTSSGTERGEGINE